MPVEIHLLGRFEVRIDASTCAAEGWRRRQGAALVKVLALAPSRRLHREQLIDRLWPDLTLEQAAPRLHKAAHFARKATGRVDTIIVDSESIVLFPDSEVVIDALVFEQKASHALATGDRDAARSAADLYRGDLLPDDLYEAWTQERREHLALRHRELLRVAGRWADLVAIDPADEAAHLALMQDLAASGDRRGALRQFERMDRVVRQELGVGPSAAAQALRDQLIAESLERPAGADDGSDQLIGRTIETATIERAIEEASSGHGCTLLISGPPGIGKSSLATWVRDQTSSRGWRTGRGTAASIEGSWPYAPVLEALADLCRRHPEILDALDDRYRAEIDNALAGRELRLDPDGTGHQRLFVAATALLRLAADDEGALLIIDDVHEADEASLRLVHYLSRSCTTEAVVIVLAHRTPCLNPAFIEVRDSLQARDAASEISLDPLDRAETEALVTQHIDSPADEVVDHVFEMSGGVPFNVLELARRAGGSAVGWRTGGATVIAALARPTREILQRVALAGATFDSDEFVALSGLDEREAFAQLDVSLAALVVVRTDAGYAFRHLLIREALLEEVSAHRLPNLHRDVADALLALGASPARVSHHLIQAGDHRRALPHVLQAAEAEASMGAYADAMALVDAVVDHAPPRYLSRLLSVRGELLVAPGKPGAVAAFQGALARASELEKPGIRAQLSRAAMMSGDLELAAAAVDGLEPDGGPNDTSILLAKGSVAFFSGDMEAADRAASDARARLATVGDPGWKLLDLITLQGLIAHTQGEWFERLRLEMQETSGSLDLAISVFDSHLCVAEYLLYGPTPYDEVIALAEALRDTATKAGAMRALAFNATLIGEAALLAGDLDRAEGELREAVDLHREIGAAAGQAHSLQRLAEVALHRGDPTEATRLLRSALPLARWSSIANHLLQRIYGTMIRAAPDPVAARATVDQAEAALSQDDACHFCEVMLAVPAAIACADVGDLDDADRLLAVAQFSGALWDGTAWAAAIDEAHAHVAAARGEADDAVRLFDEAGRGFAGAGQPLDARRCSEAGALAGRSGR